MPEPIVTSDWLNANLSDPDLIILDASQSTNKAGLKTNLQGIQIKNAIFFDLENTFCDIESNLPNMIPDPQVFESECRKIGISKHSTIVIYDNIGIYSSPRAWWMFNVFGHEKVSVLDGGLPGWVSKGYETEKTSKFHGVCGDFEAVFNPSRIKSLEAVRKNLTTKHSIIIDARSKGRFLGSSAEPRKGLSSGHIPGAINMTFEEVLNETYYKPKADLLNLFNAKIDSNQALIFMCGSGITACIVLLACELVMEHEKSVFDGSWTEWALEGDLPIAKEDHQSHL